MRLHTGDLARVPQGSLAGGHREVRIGVRPEKARIGDGGGDDGDANVLTGTVRDVSYIGVSTQYIIDTPGGDALVSFVQNVGRGSDLKSGENVRLLWDPEHTFVITDSGEVPSAEEQV